MAIAALVEGPDQLQEAAADPGAFIEGMFDKLDEGLLVEIICDLIGLMFEKVHAPMPLIQALENYDPANAAEHVEIVKQIGGMILKGEINGDLIDLIRQFLGINDVVLVQVVKGMGIDLLRAQGVLEDIIIEIEEGILDMTEDAAAASIELCKGIGAKIFGGEFGSELLDDMLTLLGMNDKVIVMMVRSLIVAALKTKNISDDLLAPIMDFDEEAASELVNSAKAIGGLLVSGDFDFGDETQLQLLLDFCGLSDELFIGLVKSAATGLLAKMNISDDIMALLEEAAASAEASMDGVKAIGKKLLTGAFDGELMDDIRALLGLTDALLVKAVRSMLVGLLRMKGVKEAIVVPLENYDESRAAEDIATAKAIGARLIKGQFNAELLHEVQQLVGLTNDVLVTLVKGMAIGLLRAKGVAESVCLEIEENTMAAEAADDIEAVKAIAGKLLKGAFNAELLDDLRALLGISDVIFVLVVRSMTIGLLRTNGVEEDLLLPLEDYDDSALAAEAFMGDAKAIGGKLLKMEFDQKLMELLQGFLGLSNDILGAIVASMAFAMMRKKGVDEEVMVEVETYNAPASESKEGDEAPSMYNFAKAKVVMPKLLTGKIDASTMVNMKKMLNLSDTALVLLVRGLTIGLLKKVGASEKATDPLKDYDTSNAADDVWKCFKVGGKLLSGKMDGESVGSIMALLGLTDAAVRGLVQQMSLGMFVKCGLQGDVLAAIEASMDGEGKEGEEGDTGAVRKVAVKLLKMDFSKEVGGGPRHTLLCSLDEL